MKKGALFDGINMVPYLDVMLVLLIIFMITAPMATPTGLQVQLPDANAGSVKIQDKPMFLIVTKKGEAFLKFEDRKMSLVESDQAIKHWLHQQGFATTGTIYVQADKRLVWERVLQTVVRVHNLGWGKWALLSE
ncbi:MAG: biopolymer transporter ExbD [Pseudomonadota bacterium]|jgi:biopolymer transport protein ExbD|nr:biopolymer transporter ExbD [Pseudomonadota bacterium]|tara:strand:+ start:2209 stop:2610 length:402 start_codon:yes stop_codon:yes gene_type:complete